MKLSVPLRDPSPASRIFIWIHASRQGDGEAFGQLAAACQPYLLAVAEAELPVGLRAKVCPADLVQETLMEAMRDFGGFVGDTLEQLLRWLRRILLNNLANTARHFQRTAKRAVAREVFAFGSESDRVHLDLRDPRPCAAIMMLHAEQQELIETALAKLSTTHRRAVLLRCRENRTFAQIGDDLGCSPEAARKLWERAVKRLRKTLGAED